MFKQVVVYPKSKLPDWFWKLHEELKDMPGLYAWSWKSHIIYNTLLKMDWGDILFYIGARFVGSCLEGPAGPCCSQGYGYYMERRQPLPVEVAQVRAPMQGLAVPAKHGGITSHAASSR